MAEHITFKCAMCKIEHSVENYKVDRLGKQLKSCIHCAEKRLKYKSCMHTKNKYRCRVCSPNKYCIHDRLKDHCSECMGKYICQHNNQTAQCKKCKGSQICVHNKIRSYCKECCGVQICSHGVNRRECNTCDPKSALWNRVRCHASGVLGLKTIKGIPTTELLGCSKLEFSNHIEAQFVGKMGWDLIGDIRIDHRTPIKYGDPTLEEKQARLHYTNCSPVHKDQLHK